MSRRTGRPSYQLSAPEPRRPTRLAVVVAAVGLGCSPGWHRRVRGRSTGRHGVGHRRHPPGRGEAGHPADRRADGDGPPPPGGGRPGSRRPAGRPARRPATRPAAGPPVAEAPLLRAAEPFANPPSGTTATNVARGGLRSAVEQASLAVESYLLAVTGPLTQRAALTALAKRQATEAATAWSVAATQLDQIERRCRPRSPACLPGGRPRRWRPHPRRCGGGLRRVTGARPGSTDHPSVTRRDHRNDPPSRRRHGTKLA